MNWRKLGIREKGEGEGEKGKGNKAGERGRDDWDLEMWVDYGLRLLGVAGYRFGVFVLGDGLGTVDWVRIGFGFGVVED